jgi:DNA-binding response OmpR family regulator
MRREQSPSASLVLTGKPVVVLVVEGDAPLRRVTAERLRVAGFEVFEAANSAEAKQVLKSTVVDALFFSVRPR